MDSSVPRREELSHLSANCLFLQSPAPKSVLGLPPSRRTTEEEEAANVIFRLFFLSLLPSSEFAPFAQQPLSPKKILSPAAFAVAEAAATVQYTGKRELGKHKPISTTTGPSSCSRSYTAQLLRVRLSLSFDN